jgi:AAA ATPase containing von Willebrand factor type A (vWA) domain
VRAQIPVDIFDCTYLTVPATTLLLVFMKNKYKRSQPFVTLKLVVSALLASISLLLGQIRPVHSFALHIQWNVHELRLNNNLLSRNTRHSSRIRCYPCCGSVCLKYNMGVKRSSRIWNDIRDTEDSFDDYNSEEEEEGADIYEDEATNDDDEYDEDLLEFDKYQVGEASPTLSKNDRRNPPSIPMYDDESSSDFLLPKDSQLQLQIQQQQKQIDLLMEMIKGSSQPQNQASGQSPARMQSQPPMTKTDTFSKEDQEQEQQQEEEETLPPPLPGMFEDEGEEELLDTSSMNHPHPTQSSHSTTPMPFYSPSGAVPLAPLKAMLFIDGTWLYYSLYRRKEEFDPIVKKFGKGWQFRYRFDWNALPRIICEQIVGQQMNLVSNVLGLCARNV